MRGHIKEGKGEDKKQQQFSVCSQNLIPSVLRTYREYSVDIRLNIPLLSGGSNKNN